MSSKLASNIRGEILHHEADGILELRKHALDECQAESDACKTRREPETFVAAVKALFEQRRIDFSD